MKKYVFLFVIAVASIAIGYAALLRSGAEQEGAGQPGAYATYQSAETGIAFEYKTGPDGYILRESAGADPQAGLVRALTLMRAADASRPVPTDSEGPPVIAVYVFENTRRQWSRTWADTHLAYSNINLVASEVEDVVVGGANAVRYMADGLYVSENVVVAHGGYVYVVTGQFIDEDSALRRDFSPLVDSIRFIPMPDQE